MSRDILPPHDRPWGWLPDGDKRIRVTEAYESYRAWCEANRPKQLSVLGDHADPETIDEDQDPRADELAAESDVVQP